MIKLLNEEDIPVMVGSDNVFADLGFPNPEEEQLKARPAYQIMHAIKRRGLTQGQAGKLLGAAQPNISNPARGHYEDFSIDRLLRFLKTLGFDVKIILEPSAVAGLDVGKGRFEEQPPVAAFAVEESGLGCLAPANAYNRTDTLALRSRCLFSQL